MIVCFSGAMYTTYVQGQNKPLGESYEATRGVIYNTPLINGDRLSFQVEDQNKKYSAVKLQNEISLGKETNATITCRSVMYI